MTARPWRYLVALGSNVPHPRHGPPRRVLAAACAALNVAPLRLIAAAPVIDSAPLGPSRRRYANGAAIVETALAPRALLHALQAIEAAFGRTRRGQRWGARVLDLDVVLWSGGPWHDRALTIPHTQFRHRAFVLTPAARIAPAWRDPLSGLSVQQLHTRLTRARPAPKAPHASAHQAPGP